MVFNFKSNAAFNNSLFSSPTISAMHPQMERLYRAAKELKGIAGQSELARFLNTSPQRVKNWESRGISKQAMLDAERLVSCSATWLETGAGEMTPFGTLEIDTAGSVMPVRSESNGNVVPFDRSKFVEIPRFEVHGSMGPGIPLPDMETIVSGIRVSAAWVRTELHNVSSPSNLAIITGYGDSMEGTFRDGDQLIVDRGVKDVKVDAIYVLSLNDELYIKRLQRRPDGSILMISDNTRYPPYVIENGERNKFSVLGRVVGSWNFSKI